MSTSHSSSIIHHCMQAIASGLSSHLSHNSLGKAVFYLLQVPAGCRRHVNVSRPPLHATPDELARRHNGAGLSSQMCDGAEKHRERWRGFDRDCQNSISRVQSGSEKLDPSLTKAYIKIWRLWKQNIYLLKISVGKLVAKKVPLAKCSKDTLQRQHYISKSSFVTISKSGLSFCVFTAEKISPSYL